MEINKFIEMGVEITGSQKALAQLLDVDVTVLSAVKAGKRGLSNVSCIKLADLINVAKIEVIAASELVTEKDEKKRKIFQNCLSRAATVAAAALIFGGSSMTSSPAHASMSENGSVNNLYYVK